MARKKFSSPVLEVAITPESYERAKKSASGGCLVADAIKAQYPHLSKVTVDMATIRASDRKEGVRYTYLTPPIAQHLLLAFDAGWPQATDHLTVRRAVQIHPITRGSGRHSPAAVAARRAERITEFERRIASGETLTTNEKRALGRLRNPAPTLDRPTSRGRAEVRVGLDGGVVLSGGKPRVQGKAHPNLLRGRDRHFGAKLADPGEVFRQAVDAAVAERLAEQPS